MFLLLTRTSLQIHCLVVCKIQHLKSKQEVEICKTRCETCSMILESDLEAYQMVRCVSIRHTSGANLDGVWGALWIRRTEVYVATTVSVFAGFSNTANHGSYKHPFEESNHLKNLCKSIQDGFLVLNGLVLQRVLYFLVLGY